jgi:hypothetical protein
LKLFVDDRCQGAGQRKPEKEKARPGVLGLEQPLPYTSWEDHQHTFNGTFPIDINQTVRALDSKAGIFDGVTPFTHTVFMLAVFPACEDDILRVSMRMQKLSAVPDVQEFLDLLIAHVVRLATFPA